MLSVKREGTVCLAYILLKCHRIKSQHLRTHLRFHKIEREVTGIGVSPPVSQEGGQAQEFKMVTLTTHIDLAFYHKTVTSYSTTLLALDIISHIANKHGLSRYP